MFRICTSESSSDTLIEVGCLDEEIFKGGTRVLAIEIQHQSIGPVLSYVQRAKTGREGSRGCYPIRQLEISWWMEYKNMKQYVSV